MPINPKETNLYNNILLLSRNKLFYTKFNLTDTFQNRIYLIFMHISFIFIKIKQKNSKQIYKSPQGSGNSNFRRPSGGAN